jgi:DNA polymerase III epsilon subunit-like protein
MATDTRIVFDLETQKSFQEVEGRKPGLLKVSLVGIYQYETGQYRAFLEDELPELERILAASSLLIGFNSRRFDMEVLAPYFTTPLERFTQLDIMDNVTRLLGHRLSLDALASATLGTKKTGSGLDALKYYKEGRWEELATYCLHDVRITKELYEYGLEHGELKYVARDTGISTALPVNWNTSRQRVLTTLASAFQRRLRVTITYYASQRDRHAGAGRERTIDIYHLEAASLEGFCHEQQALRHFRLDRILDARPSFMTYQIPADYQPAVSESTI